MRISRIEGIGPLYAARLRQAGAATTDSLLKLAAHKSGRNELAARTGISERLILEWVNRADLMRVQGVGKEYSDLLEQSGVDSVRELGQRRPENLHSTLETVNANRNLVRRVPSLRQVQRWVDQAKRMPPVVTH